MADISTETQKILSAVYGEEVRGALVDALNKMNEIDEDAEAYAAGTRGGTAVPSTDPAYHNNAKYYSENAGTVAEAWTTGGTGGTPSATNNAKYYAEQAAESATMLVVDPTLSVSGRAADAAAVGHAVDGLVSQSGLLLSVDPTIIDHKGISITDGGTTSTNNNLSYTDYVNVLGCKYVEITMPIVTASSPGYGLAFYDTSKARISGVRVHYGAEETGYEVRKLNIPENAAYLRSTWFSSDGDFSSMYSAFSCQTYKSGAIPEEIAVLTDRVSADEKSSDLIPNLTRVSGTYISLSTGEERSSGNFRYYKMPAENASTVYANLYCSGSGDATVAAIAFYSGDVDTENYMASESVGLGSTSGWHEYSAAVPSGCVTIVFVLRINYAAGSGDPYVKTPIREEIENKLDSNFGSENFGKFLSVGEDGGVELINVSIPESSSTNVFPGVLLLRNEIPEQYIEIPENPVSFDDGAYIEQKILEVPDNPTFIFSTDEHYDKTAGRSDIPPGYDWHDVNNHHIFPLLSYVRNRLGIRPVMFGGDLIDGEPTKYSAKISAAEYTSRILAEFGGNYLLVQGNHDSNLPNPEDYTEESMRLRYFPPSALWEYEADHRLPAVYPDFGSRIDQITQDATERAELRAYFKMTYYIDYPELHTRFIVVNTGSPSSRHKTGDKEIYNIHYPFYLLGLGNWKETYLAADFVYHALRDVPSGYNIVIAGHWFLSTSEDDLIAGAKMLCRMLSARKQKVELTGQDVMPAGSDLDVNLSLYRTWIYTSGDPFWPTNHSSGTDINVDFRGLPDVGTVMMICGHDHKDRIMTCHVSDHEEGTVDSRNYTFTTYDSSIDDPIDQTVGEVPCICTQCENWVAGHASPTSPYASPMILGTTTDQCFDVVTISEESIACTRIGAGNSRIVRISNS